MTPLLKIDNVNTYYGESHVLQGLSFDIRRGEIVALLGRNGVGKTTTIQTILGLPAPRSGTIEFSGQVISKLSTAEIIAQGIGWVPQGHRIFPTLSVEENLELASLKGRRGDWNTNRVFEYFPRLNVRRKARGDSLSGGEQQMLAIGRALVQNPDLFLLVRRRTNSHHAKRRNPLARHRARRQNQPICLPAISWHQCGGSLSLRHRSGSK